MGLLNVNANIGLNVVEINRLLFCRKSM